MSSILKALKKIEEESPHPQPFPSQPRTTETKKRGLTRAMQRLSVRQLVAALVILLSVTAAVAVFSQRQLIIAKILSSESLEQKNETAASPSEKSVVFKAKIPSVPAKSTTKARRQIRSQKSPPKTDVSNRKAKRLQADARSVKPQTSKAGQQTNMQTAKRKPQAVTPSARTKSVKKKTPIRRASVSKKTIAGKRAALVKSAPRTKKSSPAKTYARIDDSKLKLQALAWFEDAAKRMAVINDRIVREGESVDGFNVIHIHRENVVVNDGKKMWSLEFGLKP